MRRKYIPHKSYFTKGYWVSHHAVYDMNFRSISKSQLSYNLTKKPLLRTRVRIDPAGRPSFLIYSRNKIFTVINPIKRWVCSVRKFHWKEYRKEKNDEEEQNRR